LATIVYGQFPFPSVTRESYRRLFL